MHMRDDVALLYEPINVELINKMGDDLTVVNAARVSFAKESKELDNRDIKLINYLAKHNHWTPFGHITATFRIKAPIFVARQLVKHQVGLVWNEVSRRYVDSDPTFYCPENWRARADNVKQGSSDQNVTSYRVGIERIETTPQIEYDAVISYCLQIYREMIDQGGIAPEMARIVLPTSTMTEWWWTGSVAAYARVCKLRLDPHAQYETRLVAEDIDSALRVAFPYSWNALMNNNTTNAN